MKNKYVFVFLMLFSILVVSFGLTNIYVSRHQPEKEEDFVVVTSFYPMYIAAMNIIGDTEDVTLKNLSEPQTGCLHDFQLTPADMKLLSTADVFIINGGGIESFMEDIAEQYPELVVIEACEGVELLSDEHSHDEHSHDEHSHDEYLQDEDLQDENLYDEHLQGEYSHEELHTEDEHEEIHGTEVHDHDAEHNHEDESEHLHELETEHNHEDDLERMDDAEAEHNHEVNAHAWMSVKNYRKQVENIANGLAKAEPDYAASFLANAGEYDRKLEELQVEQEKLIPLTEGEEVVMFHCAYDYVAEDLDLEVAFCMDLDEERQVSAGEVAEVLEIIQHHGVKYIFAEELYGTDMCEMVKKEVDVEVIYLDPLNRGEYEADSYLEGMRNNMRLMAEVFH